MSAPESVRDRAPAPVDATTTGRRVFSTLTALASLAVVLQGLWAGEFLQHTGADRASRINWVQVHARGGEVAIALALVATVWALLRLRSRRDLIIGAGALTVLLIAVAYVGGLISDHGLDTLIPVHIPLALATLVVGVWATLQGRRASRDPSA